jgi:hypothetical protein
MVKMDYRTRSETCDRLGEKCNETEAKVSTITCSKYIKWKEVKDLERQEFVV